MQIGEYASWIIKQFLNLPINSRIIRERFENITIRKELTLKEKELLFIVLINRKEAFAFNWDYYKIIRLKVALL